MAPLEPDLAVIAKALDPWACQVAVATMASILGYNEEWSSDEIEDVGGCIHDVLKGVEVPDPLSASSSAFWQKVLDA